MNYKLSCIITVYKILKNQRIFLSPVGNFRVIYLFSKIKPEKGFLKNNNNSNDILRRTLTRNTIYIYP